MLVAAVVAAAGELVVGLYVLLPRCGGRSADGMMLACLGVTVVTAAVALIGSPIAWRASSRAGRSTATARWTVALSLRDGVGCSARAR